MSEYRLICAKLLMILFPLTGLAQPQWFTTEEPKCDDPLALASYITSVSWYQSGALHYKTGSKSTDIYVEMTTGEFNTSKAGVVTLSTHKLIASDAPTLRSILNTKAKTLSIPLVLQSLTTILPGYVLSATASAGTGGLFGYLFAKLQAASTEASLLSNVVASGGQVDRNILIIPSKNHQEHLLEVFEYEVKVGDENRHYVMTSCLYPLSVVLNAIKTIALHNNKILKKQGSNTWRQFDVETNSYDPGSLEQVEIDGDFLYLTENDPKSFTNNQRVSLVGGPWQFLQGNQWMTLYSKTKPE